MSLSLSSFLALQLEKNKGRLQENMLESYFSEISVGPCGPELKGTWTGPLLQMNTVHNMY